MKFNVVIGNPPYNKGMDLDFMDLGYRLSTEYTSMIVPAKWQIVHPNAVSASRKVTYDSFREKYIKNMSKLVFYPDCLDVFEIARTDGVVYYLLDKEEHEKCEVTNKCVRQQLFNNFEVRDIRHKETLNNIGNEIIESLGSYKTYHYAETTVINKKYYVATTKQFASSLGQGGNYDWTSGEILKGSAGQGGLLFTKDGQVNVLSKSVILKSSNELPSSNRVTFQSDSLEECNNFLTWLYSNFVKFFLLINTCLQSPLSPYWFRFVPEPDVKADGSYDFMHPYTDEYLYKKYNLSAEYINVIESSIKRDLRLDKMQLTV